jgi:hypothetical protein
MHTHSPAEINIKTTVSTTPKGVDIEVTVLESFVTCCFQTNKFEIWGFFAPTPKDCDASKHASLRIIAKHSRGCPSN